MTHKLLIILGDTLLYMTTKFMEEVTQPYIGYRLRPRYTRLVSEHPENAGHLFRDANGRPSGLVLSSLYLGPGHHTYIDGKLILFFINIT